MKLYDNNITHDLAGIIQEIYHYVCSCSVRKTSTNSDAYIIKRLKINEKDHEVIISIYWLLEDTELAINEFNKFQLQGPTRVQDNLGEKYLRLYGVLSAMILQKSAIIRLYELFQINNKKDIAAKMNSLKVVSLRHKISAHALDYVDGKMQKNYRISRFSLNDNQLELHLLNKSEFEKYNLLEVINEFKETFNVELFKICSEILNKIVPKGSGIEKELSIKLHLVNERLHGNIVIEGLDSLPSVILKFDSKG